MAKKKATKKTRKRRVIRQTASSQSATPSQNPNATGPDFYDIFKEKSKMYSTYKGALDQASHASLEMRDIGLLRNLAVPIGPDDYVKASLSECNDSDVLCKWVRIGYKRNAKAFEEHGDAHLGEILKRTKPQNLELMLTNVKLKDSSDNVSYKDALTMHRKYQEMYKTLADSQREDATEEQKKKASESMKEGVIKFYKSEYGNDSEMLDALKSLVEIDEQLRQRRYMGFVKEKGKRFDEKVGTHLDSYLKSAVADKLECYAILATDLSDRQQ